MANNATGSADSIDRHLYILGRWQEYEGEARANVLRITAVGAFYIVELINYYGLELGFIELPKVADAQFHMVVTALAVAWTMLALGVLLCLHQRFFPALLKYVSTGGDIVLLTAVLVAASGPRSPLIVAYFVLIVLSTLRFNLPLIRFATLASMAGYLFLLAYARWFTERDLRVPAYHQIIMLLALGLSGIVLGQVIRRVRGLIREFADRVASEQQQAADGVQQTGSPEQDES